MKMRVSLLVLPFLSLLAISLDLSFGSAIQEKMVFTSAEHLNDREFGSYVLFESPAVCAEDCALRCSSHDACVTFTFHQNTCRGHEVFFTSSDPSAPALGARSFATRGEDGAWRYTPCTANSECTQLEANAVCFKGRCLCTPGWFYSVATKTCVQVCRELKFTYTLYPGSGIESRNKETIKKTTAAVCKAACDADPDCLNLELLTNRNCHTHHVAATTELLVTNDEAHYQYFFQRDCA